MLDEPLVEILRALTRHRVEFIIVGGVASVLQGAPVVTFDLDIMHRRTDENVTRLLAALDDLYAMFRDDRRRLRPTASHLIGPGHLLLTTAQGPLDVLGTIGAGMTYDTAIDDADAFDLEQMPIRVLALPRIIASKEQAGRPKDVATLPILRATLDEIRRRG